MCASSDTIRDLWPILQKHLGRINNTNNEGDSDICSLSDRHYESITDTKDSDLAWRADECAFIYII